MAYTDLRDFCPEVIYPVGPLYERGATPIRIEIEKLGGGTLGKSYSGKWRYQLRVNDVVTEYGQDLDTPTPSTHLQAAILVADYFEAKSSDEMLTARLSEWRSQFEEG